VAQVRRQISLNSAAVGSTNQLPYQEDVIVALMERHYLAKGRAFHGSHPRDLLNHVIHLARYLGVEPELTAEMLDEACETYFVEDTAD